jgi:hypothetical protein
MLVHAAGLPAAFCDTFLPADNRGAERLVTDPRVAFLSFHRLGRRGLVAARKARPGYALRAGARRRGAAPSG